MSPNRQSTYRADNLGDNWGTGQNEVAVGSCFATSSPQRYRAFPSHQIFERPGGITKRAAEWAALQRANSLSRKPARAREDAANDDWT